MHLADVLCKRRITGGQSRGTDIRGTHDGYQKREAAGAEAVEQTEAALTPTEARAGREAKRP